jgi:hypothetical protein
MTLSTSAVAVCSRNGNYTNSLSSPRCKNSDERARISRNTQDSCAHPGRSVSPIRVHPRRLSHRHTTKCDSERVTPRPRAAGAGRRSSMTFGAPAGTVSNIATPPQQVLDTSRGGPDGHRRADRWTNFHGLCRASLAPHRPGCPPMQQAAASQPGLSIQASSRLRTPRIEPGNDQRE